MSTETEYTNCISLEQMEYLDLFDNIPYKVVKKIVKVDDDTDFEVEIKDLPHDDYNKCFTSFKFTLEIDISQGDLPLMVEKHYTPPLRKYAYLHKGFHDDTYPPHEYLKEILNFMDLHIKEKKGKVLVHCAMGISRSGGLVVAWLLKENPSWSWRDAVNCIWKSRQILPAVEIRESVLDYFESIEGHRRNY